VKRLVAAAAILLAVGCDRMLTKQPQRTYMPWEEGLTLVYADPGAPMAQRLQSRVKQSKVDPAGGRAIVMTYTTLSGQSEASFHTRDGLVALKLESGPEIRLLPEGFPDRVTTWEDRGFVNTIVGRAKVDLPGVKLPDPDATGIWIESRSVGTDSLRRRTLLVPDLGEVETLNWKNGRWVVVNRLVSQGFTDLTVVEGGR
jgi:hypothetical protein